MAERGREGARSTRGTNRTNRGNRTSHGRSSSEGSASRGRSGQSSADSAVKVGASRTPSGYAGRPRAKRSKASPARRAALGVVRAVRERNAFAQELIAKDIDNSALSREDRAFATRLVLGVVSSTGTLDEVIDRALRSPDDVQPDVRDALRISAYEIVFLGKSAHAAVDQGVELARYVAPAAAGLANAALRRMVQLRDEFPFGDPTRDVDALARLHAFPTWLAKRLISDLGAQEAVDFMRASNEPAPLFVAVNAAKASEDEVRAAFASAGTRLEAEAVCGAFVPGCFRVSDTRTLQDPDVKALFARGKMLVSDAASQAVAAAILPERKPTTFLEIGAGRATKTILLQSGAVRAWGSQMELTALDNRAFKVDVLRERTRRYGVHVADALVADALKLGQVLAGREFDMVFVDAPCTGLGTLRRHPEIRWRLEPQSIARSARTQLALLESAAGCVALGGMLAYATCTVTHDENNGVVKAFLASESGQGFKLVPTGGGACLSTRLSPGSSDAHFAVRFVRES